MSTPFQKVKRGNIGYCQKFSKEVAEGQNGNLVHSPISCLIALAMALAGAKGESILKIARGLHLPDNLTTALEGLSRMMKMFQETRNVELAVANKIYIRKDSPIAEDYSSSLKQYFDIEAENVVFMEPETVEKINDWVAKQTNNKIKNLVDTDSFDTFTRLVLVNAVYFNGTWQHQFDESRTRNMPFYIDNEKTVDVPFMYKNTYLPHKNLEELDAQLISMYYRGRDLSMEIILPNKRDGLKELEEKLATANLSEILNSGLEGDMVVYLPKFKVETSLDLGKYLTKMGLEHIFSDNVDFSGISPSGANNLKVSKVMQKAFIEVNEVGTEAAAATAIVMSDGMTIKRPPSIKCDHPFVFYLTYDRSFVIFGGRVTNPA
ncbi:antichymotrypsin-2-like [Cloeon dipterum]|uniref:antichymotrypsin-2-like n=1 Tax=Cloeon dipterum TaxID=197152 RepID=UPI00321F9795